MEGSPEGVKVPSIAEEEPLQGVMQILHEVELIDDLECLGRPLPNAFSIETTPIAADALDAGMHLQPLRNGGGRAL